MSLHIEILSNYIAPIFIASGIGAVFSRVFKPDVKAMARLAFHVLSPCLVFSALTTTAIPVADILRLAGFTVSVVCAAGGLAWVLGRMLKMSGGLIAALMLSCMFVNAGNYGLALNLFAFGEDAMASALIFYMVSTMLVFSLGVAVASHGKVGGRQALVGMLKVPALYALALAGLTRGLGLPIPQLVQRPVSLLAQASIPIMLLILGMHIERARWSGRILWVGMIVGIRMLIMPVVAAAFASLFQLSGSARQAAIVETAMPTAVIVAILALEYDVEPELVTEAVIATTLLSPFVLTPLIVYLSG